MPSQECQLVKCDLPLFHLLKKIAMYPIEAASKVNEWKMK